MTQALKDPQRWTTADIESLAADEWKRYEIIDGELFVTRAPHIGHQGAAGRIYARLLLWSEETNLGQPILTPGLIFSDADNVIPDVVWVSDQRLAAIVDDEGHLTDAPELVVEVLSAGGTNERRDKEAKLKLYSLKGVQEYWIVDWRLQQIEVYRRDSAQLQLVGTLLATDDLSSPLLPDFRCTIERFF
ncbi:Uma2 family endonuclease [Acaryochloris sp. IP29b_bin.148]|uniref:Uma2 family endonuclease n=1 Tax=Acaryochloris sp. IP29b_bin.148 TaxID=2969218 RepID=UPI002614DCAB|nr:Uma2 family endonuclease [Acaryochloris sp. IP29b_bin.148]